MKTLTLVCSLAALLCGFNATAQYYNVTFRGTFYETNASGNIAATPLTETTLLAAVGNTNELSLVYHVEPGGDSIKVIRNSDGGWVMTYFMFLFGEDSTLGRSGLTNATQTEIRRVDYIYSLNWTPFTSYNTHSQGAAFITRRILKDAQNNVRHSIDGLGMQWTVLPHSGRSTRVCFGNFQTGAVWTRP